MSRHERAASKWLEDETAKVMADFPAPAETLREATRLAIMLGMKHGLVCAQAIAEAEGNDYGDCTGAYREGAVDAATCIWTALRMLTHPHEFD